MEINKKCVSCKKFKTLEYFCKDKNKKYGHSNQCKECKKV